MDWKLLVWEPNTIAANQTEANSRAVYTPIAPGGLLDGFEWACEHNGNCVDLTFWGSVSTRKNTKRLDISAADIIQLQIDPEDTGTLTNAFKGVIIENPQIKEKRKRKYVALGLKELFKRRTLDIRRIRVRQDVNEFVDDISDLFPVQVGYTKHAITSGELNELYAPGIRLSEALDLLAQSVEGYDWGVDADGNLLFAIASGNTTIEYKLSGMKLLPIHSQDIATKINLIVLNGKANQELNVYGINAESDANYRVETTDSYFAERISSPVIHEYEDPKHSKYLAERTYIVNSPLAYIQADPTRNPYELSPATVDTFNNSSNILDTNLSTKATFNGVSNWPDVVVRKINASALDNTLEPSIGVRIIFEVSRGEVELKLFRRRGDSGTTVVERYEQLIVDNAASFRDLFVLIPPDDRYRNGLSTDLFELVTPNIAGTEWANTETFDVYAVLPLFLDTTALDNLAKDLIVLPSIIPAELNIKGYKAPSAQVTITGTSDGDLTGTVKLFSYTMKFDKGMRTSIDLEEQSEEDTSRAIRLKAQEVTLASQNTLRTYLDGGV